jgi:hypothetical protein
MEDMGAMHDSLYPTDLERGIGLRRRITSAGQAALVTLGYPEVVISLRKLRYRAGSAGPSQGLLRTPQKPHKSATQWLIPTGIPRTKRHTPVHL